MSRLGDRRNMRFMVPATESGKFDYPFPGDPSLYGAPQHQYDILTAHAVFNSELMRAYVAANPFFVTNVREPGAQAVSSYNFEGSKWTLDGTWEEHLARIRTTEPDQ